MLCSGLRQFAYKHQCPLNLLPKALGQRWRQQTLTLGAIGQRLALVCLLAMSSSHCSLFSSQYGAGTAGLDIATQNALRQQSMRMLRTEQVRIYYPTQNHVAAEQLAANVSKCMAQLTSLLPNQPIADAVANIVWLGNVDNNAYVSLAPNSWQRVRLTQFFTSEAFLWLGLGVTDLATVTCHELVHQVVFANRQGFWGTLTNVFGIQAADPAFYLNAWLHEGLAIYYEGKLNNRGGRNDNVLWRGAFMAGVAENNESLQAAQLHPSTRETSAFGGHYVVGSQFVAYLNKRFGEQRIWQLLDQQANSILSPILLSSRFRDIFGRNIADLFSEFRQSLADTIPKQARHPGQQVFWPERHRLARLATCPSKGLAVVIRNDIDVPIQAVLLEQTGNILWQRSLTNILPGRALITPSTAGISGLSFNGDCSAIYFTTTDSNAEQMAINKLIRITSDTGHLEHIESFQGIGGDIAPDEQHYLFTEPSLSGTTLQQLALTTGGKPKSIDHRQQASIFSAKYQPNGPGIAYLVQTDRGSELWYWHAEQATCLWQGKEILLGIRWWDQETILLWGEHNQQTQAMLFPLASAAEKQRAQLPLPVSQAPYLIFDPSPWQDNSFLALQADGWTFHLDQYPILPVQIESVAPPIEPVTTPDDGLPTPSTAIVEPSPSLPETVFTEISATTSPSPIPTLADKANLAILADEPYQPFFSLAPTLRSPGIEIVNFNNLRQSLLYLELLGSDHLSQHQYGLKLASSIQRLGVPIVQLNYSNRLLSPLLWSVSAATNWRSLRGTARLRLLWYTHSLELQHASSLPLPANTLAVQPMTQRLEEQIYNAMTALALTYSARESGSAIAEKTRRALQLSLSLSHATMPALSLHQIDSMASLVTVVPLPLWRRHTLTTIVQQKVPVASNLPPNPQPVANRLAIQHMQFMQPATLRPRLTSFLVDALQNMPQARLANALITSCELTYLAPIVLDWGWHSILDTVGSGLLREISLGAVAAALAPTTALQNYLYAAGPLVQLDLAIAPGLPTIRLLFRYIYQSYDQEKGPWQLQWQVALLAN